MPTLTWADISIGDVIDHEGGPAEVRVLKLSGKKGRAVLGLLEGDPDPDEPNPKIAAKVNADEPVALWEGEPDPEAQEREESAVEAILGVMGATEVAEVPLGGDRLICPAPDVTNVAAHLKIIHGIELKGLPVDSEDEYLRIHKELHEAPYHEPKFAHEHREGKDDE